MYYLVILVIDDINKAPYVMDAWEEAGVGGITILESTGVARLHSKTGYRDDTPLLPSLRSLLNSREEHHRTIFSIVDGEEKVSELIAATQSVVGQLHEPDTGILFAIPLSHVVGFARRDYSEENEGKG
jgi:hypothetical protein